MVIAMKKYTIISKIANKFFIAIVVTVILPAFCISYLLHYHFIDFISDEIGQNVIESDQRTEIELEDISQTMHNMAMMFMRDKNFISLLRQPEMDTFQINRVFDDLYANIVNLNLLSVNHIEITFLDMANNVYTSWNNNFSLEQDEDVFSWVEEAQQLHGGLIWKTLTPVFSLDQKADEKYVSLLCSLYNPENLQQYLGTIIISVKSSYLRTVFEKHSYLQDEVYICLPDGEVKLNLYQTEELSQQELKELGDTVGTKSYANVFLKGTNYMVTKCRLPDSWKIEDQSLTAFCLIDQNDIVKQFAEFSRAINILLVCAVLVILLFTYLWITKMVHPIIRLSEKMQSYQLDQKVSGLDLKRNDEIGDLNRSFVQMSDYIINLVEKIRQESAFKEKYQYEALVAQLTPHFLFNTLNTIRWMALIRKADNIVNCIDALGNLLKYSMNKEGEIVSLQEELVQIKSYIDIQNYRFGDHLKLVVDIDEELLSLQVVKFILQPVVENSVKYAFKSCKGQGEIKITAYLQDHALKLIVKDNGDGIKEDVLKSISMKVEDDEIPNSVTGIGIHHVAKRIQSLYGKNYGIQIQSREQEYTIVEFTLPVIEDSSGNDSSTAI